MNMGTDIKQVVIKNFKIKYDTQKLGRHINLDAQLLLANWITQVSTKAN